MENIFKKINIVFSIALILILLMTIYSNITKSSEIVTADDEDKVEKIKILIDPGHGGKDLGASGDKGDEAPINLAISKNLMKFLEGSGFVVEMTRYDDEDLSTAKSDTIRERKNEDLSNRVKLINESKADLVVSIHLNSFPQKQYYGAHVFYKKNNENSKQAANIIQENMKNILDKNNERVPQIKKDIKIIDKTELPIVLIECGFLSNPEEEMKLITKEYQEKTAWSIYVGLLNYFNKIK